MFIVVSEKGEHIHTGEDIVCNFVRKDEREKLEKALDTQTPVELHRNLLASKLKKNKPEVDAGNRDGAYSLHTLQKISSDKNSKHDKSKDVFQALVLEAAEAAKKYGDGSVFLLSHTPFGLAWCTKNQALHHQKTLQLQKPCISYLDATRVTSLFLSVCCVCFF